MGAVSSQVSPDPATSWVCGIDLSLTATALLLRRGPESAAPESVIIRTRPGVFSCDAGRMAHIRDEVIRHLRRLPGKGLVCIEAPALAARGRAVSQIFGLNAVVRVGLWDLGAVFVDVMPAEVKKFVTGSGVADKQVILREVWRRFSYEAEDDNSADAYVLSEIAWRLAGFPAEKETEFQRKVLENIRRREKL